MKITAALILLLVAACAAAPKVDRDTAGRCELACQDTRADCYNGNGGAYWDYCEADLEDCLELCY
jgi:hypothetical protein